MKEMHIHVRDMSRTLLVSRGRGRSDAHASRTACCRSSADSCDCLWLPREMSRLSRRRNTFTTNRGKMNSDECRVSRRISLVTYWTGTLRYHSLGTTCPIGASTSLPESLMTPKLGFFSAGPGRTCGSDVGWTLCRTNRHTETVHAVGSLNLWCVVAQIRTGNSQWTGQSQRNIHDIHGLDPPQLE